MAASEDRAEIHEALVRYATAIDTRDWELLRTVFTDDCRMEAGNQGLLEGADAVVAHMERLHAPLDASVHRVTNIAVDVDGDQAHARAYLDALLIRQDHPAGPTFHVIGTYDDELVRLGGEWRIRRRAFRATWREGNQDVFTP